MPARIGNPARRRRHFIAEWRDARGYTQEYLAALVGTTKAQISRIESGKGGYTQDGLEAISDALDVQASVLISRPPREDEKQPPALPEPARHSSKRPRRGKGR